MGLLCVMLTGESLYCSPDSGGGEEMVRVILYLSFLTLQLIVM